MKNPTTGLVVGMAVLGLGCATPETHQPSRVSQSGEEMLFPEMLVKPDTVYVDMLPAFELYVHKKHGVLNVAAKPNDKTKAGIHFQVTDDGWYRFSAINQMGLSLTWTTNSLM